MESEWIEEITGSSSGEKQSVASGIAYPNSFIKSNALAWHTVTEIVIAKRDTQPLMASTRIFGMFRFTILRYDRDLNDIKS